VFLGRLREVVAPDSFIDTRVAVNLKILRDDLVITLSIIF